jgi:hypothetical protein
VSLRCQPHSRFLRCGGDFYDAGHGVVLLISWHTLFGLSGTLSFLACPGDSEERMKPKFPAEMGPAHTFSPPIRSWYAK